MRDGDCIHPVELLQAVRQVLIVGELPRKLHQQRIQRAPHLTKETKPEVGTKKYGLPIRRDGIGSSSSPDTPPLGCYRQSVRLGKWVVGLQLADLPRAPNEPRDMRGAQSPGLEETTYLLMQTAGLELVLCGLELVADRDLGRGLDVVVEQHREAHLPHSEGRVHSEAREVKQPQQDRQRAWSSVPLAGNVE